MRQFSPPPGLALAGCGGSKTLLSAKDPTMLSIWHVYGEQADSPMNRLLTEFNDTVGKEKGILLNVTNMTNSAAIGGQLQDAKAGKPGTLNLPDLFSAHPSDASGLGIENLVDWNDWFTAEDMAAYVPGFVQDGIIEVGYHAKAKALYDSLRQRQKDYPQRLANGETLEALTEETWQLLCDNA